MSSKGASVYLFLAFFWFAAGAVIQIFWSSFEPYLRHGIIPLDRATLGWLFFVLFSYNFIRWRISRLMLQSQRKDAESLQQRRRRINAEIDPTFDFSDAKPEDEQEKKPPPL